MKDRVGTGYWSRNKHELLLIGTRGYIPAPARGTQCPSATEAPVGRHSEKPAVFYEIIERYFPNLPKIELHARSATLRPGWDMWGLEAPNAPHEHQASAGVDEADEIDDGVDIFEDAGVVDAIDAFEDAAAYEMEDAHETR